MPVYAFETLEALLGSYREDRDEGRFAARNESVYMASIDGHVVRLKIVADSWTLACGVKGAWIATGKDGAPLEPAKIPAVVEKLLIRAQSTDLQVDAYLGRLARVTAEIDRLDEERKQLARETIGLGGSQSKVAEAAGTTRPTLKVWLGEAE